MAMIVETGEGLENADTFISPADAAARVAEEASYPLLARLTEAELEPHLRSVFRWMKTGHEDKITGVPRNYKQTGLFPRCGARTAWQYVGAGEIPREIIDAQLAAAEASAAGNGLSSDVGGGRQIEIDFRGEDGAGFAVTGGSIGSNMASGGVRVAREILRRYYTRR